MNIAVDRQKLATNVSDTLTICLNGQSLVIVDSEWPYRQAQGATLGNCASPASSAASVASSSRSSSVSSAAASSSVASSAAGGGGGGGGTDLSTCTTKYSLGTDNLVTLKAASSVVFTNMLSQITFGAGGPSIPVHVCYSKDNGASLSTLYGSNGNCNSNGNAYGSAVTPGGTDAKSLNLTTGDRLLLSINGRYQQQGWLAFDQTFVSNDKTGHILYMKNGDVIGNYSGFGNQTSLKSYLVSKGMATSGGTVTIGACQILAVTELGTLGSSGADFQDDVMLMQFN